jgi:glycosyltransferase involved in cell wall biosynthesis
VAWDIACLMRDQGHDVTVLCYRLPGFSDDASLQPVDGISVRRFVKPELSVLRLDRYQRLGEIAGRAAKDLERDGIFDIVHVHSPVLGLGVSAALGRRRMLVTTVHSPVVDELNVNWPDRDVGSRVRLFVGALILRRIEASLLTQATSIHVLSEFTRGRMSHYHGAAIGARCTMIPHWFKATSTDVPDKRAARRALGWREEGVALFTLRNLRPRYGLDIAVEAVAPLLGAHGARLYIGGDGPLRNTLERKVETLGINNHVSFLGRLPDDDVELAYCASDLFLLPTKALECFGLIVLEALAHGCPVLATDAGAIPEVLGPLLPTFIVPAGNVGAMQSALAAFMRGDLSPPSAHRIQSALRERYAPQVVHAELLRLFDLRSAA